MCSRAQWVCCSMARTGAWIRQVLEGEKKGGGVYRRWDIPGW